MSEPARVLLIGAAGRMGEAIAKVAKSNADIAINAGAERGDDVEQLIQQCDVVIDFSHADATAANCAAALAHRKPIVIGTTGHTDEQKQAALDAARTIAVLIAANFSIGVNTLFWLTLKAAQLLGDSFDIEIVETHHRFKKDAPSGTAKRLVEVLCEARGIDQEKNISHGREGLVGERRADEIGVHAIRAGDVVGDHTVIFAGAGERLELTHKASSRETFALGALRAARWIIGKPPGLYRMEDVLGL